jgi:hypothetical protein
MSEIVNIYLSWQFLLIGIIVFLIFAFFNDFLGPWLWRVQNTKWRKVMKFFEGIKMVWPPLLGFGLGWVPGIPRPDALMESSQLTVALLYLIAGLSCQWLVKAIKKALEARGIDVDLDFTPKEQKKLK